MFCNNIIEIVEYFHFCSMCQLVLCVIMFDPANSAHFFGKRHFRVYMTHFIFKQNFGIYLVEVPGDTILFVNTEVEIRVKWVSIN